MFTGLVEAVGTVAEVRPGRGATRLAIASPLPLDEMQDGESISVDGVCLTVARRTRDRFEADAVAETLSRSTLSGMRTGRRVNLERALRAGDRLGGHLVQGHVDAAPPVVRVRRRGQDWRLRIALPPSLRPYVVEKGSIAVSGVSLTVSAVDGASFEVVLIPETVARTTLGELRAGDAVNVEADVVARYLEGLVLGRSPGGMTSAPRIGRRTGG